MNSNTISVIGLGKLGMPLAASLATKGFQVIGADMDPQKVRAVNEGRSPVFEPGLSELISAGKERLGATEDLESAVLASEVTFILVPTPSEPLGGFSLRHVLPVCEAIGRALRSKGVFHNVVLTSTVMPGSTDNEIRPALEIHSGKRCGYDFGLCYNPEFVALGSVLRDMLNPDFVLIGESDSRSGDGLVNIYRKLCNNDPSIARMNFVNAELTKLAVNTFVTTKISFANMLARMCEQLPGADVDTVTSALGLDSRIGGKYLKGAIGYGGPCFPRDNLALAALARSIGAPATLAEATDSSNQQQVGWLAGMVKSRLTKGGRVGILGLAYKPNSDVAEKSQGLLLAMALTSEGVAVVAYDPVASDNARKILHEHSVDNQREVGIIFASSADECIRQADVVVIATPWEEFKHLTSPRLARHSPPRVVIDCWRLLNCLDNEDGVAYIPLGVGDLRVRDR